MAIRSCARPDCSRLPDASLSYQYASRTVWIEQLHPVVEPSSYDLCEAHARRLRVPHGWSLVDRRRHPLQPELFGVDPATSPAPSGGAPGAGAAVAVLAVR